MADDLGRFVRGEPVTARPVGTAERVRKWVRRRPAAAGLLAALALMVVVGSVGAWLFFQQRASAGVRQAQIDREVRGSLEWARSLLEEGWRAHDQTRLTAAMAEGKRVADIARSGGASAVVRQEAEALREDAALRLERAKKNQALMEAILDVLDPQETRAYGRDGGVRVLVPAGPSVDAQYAAAFRRWGLDVDGSAEATVAERLRQEPDVVVQELLAGLDAWSIARRLQGRPEAQWRRLSRIADRLDRSDQRRRLRALFAEGARPRAENVAGFLTVGPPWPAPPWPALWELTRGNTWRQLREARRTIDPQTEPVPTVLLLTLALVEVGDVAGAEEVLHQAATARPGQVPLLHALGKLLDERWPGRLEEAIGYYRAARAQRPRLGVALSNALARAGRATQGEEVLRDLDRQQPGNPAISFFLGVNLLVQEKHREAEAACQRAIDLKPDDAEAHCNLGTALQAQERYAEAEAACRGAIDLRPDLIEAHNNLGAALSEQARHGEAEAAYRKAIDVKPDVAEVWYNLGATLSQLGRHRDAEPAFRRAIGLKPDFALAHNNLGAALHALARYRDAEAAYRRAIGLKPDYAVAYCNLANVLNELREPVEAEATSRRAIDLKPDLPDAYHNLANALLVQQRYGEAERASRMAIKLQPGFALAYNSLGTALDEQRKHDDAVAAYRQAIDLKPDFAAACYNLGNSLFRQGKNGEAVSALRKAVELKPDFAQAYNNLGMALGLQKNHAEAEMAFRKAIGLTPDLVNAHLNLGSALLSQGKPGEAETAFRRAIDLKPEIGLAHHNLGIALMRQARFEEAVASLRKGADLFPARSPYRDQERQLQQQCQRFVILDGRLPAILQGTKEPANATEQIEFAQLCSLKKLYAAAARFYRDAFTAEPKIAEAVPAGARYSAACAAALAGCGRGQDATSLDEAERKEWRDQARRWLRADLIRWAKPQSDADTRERMKQWLMSWQGETDLAGLREAAELAKLGADERRDCLALWDEVAEAIKRNSGHEGH